jgi:hypothetical protein
MAQENFLINPPKRLGRRKRKRNPIGETLVTIGANPMRKNPENPWYGDSSGHRIAALMRWGKVRRGKVSRHRKRTGGRVVAKRKAVRRVVRKRVSLAAPRRRRLDMRTRAYRAERMRQQREAASYMGMISGPLKSRKRKFKFVSGAGWKRIRNPFGGVIMARRRKRVTRKRNSWFGQPRRHKRAAKKGWRRGHLLKRGSVRRRVKRNPANAIGYRRRSRRRSYRRNPALGATIGQFTSGVMNVRDWAPLAVTGGLSAITGAVVPQMIGVVNPWAKLGVQTAVAIGGGLVVEKVIDKRHGQAWMVVGVAMVGYQLLKQFVLMPYFPQFAIGLGGYQDYYPNSDMIEGDEVSQQVGAFPGQLGAFVSGYPGVGEDESVGAYPYDGAGY